MPRGKSRGTTTGTAEAAGVERRAAARSADRDRRSNATAPPPPQRDQTAADSSADQKMISFLREQVESLKGEINDFRNVVDGLTHEIRAEDGAFRKKYNAKRRQVQRLEKILNEHGTAQVKKLVASVDQEDDVEQPDQGERPGDAASALMQLANCAEDFLAKGLEQEACAEDVQVIDTQMHSPTPEPRPGHGERMTILTENYYSPLIENEDNDGLADVDAEPELVKPGCCNR